MRKIIILLLIFSASSFVLADNNDLDQYREETDALWRSGTGAQDGAFSAISTSMIGWGLGLGAVIAIVASVLHQSATSTAHTAHECP